MNPTRFRTHGPRSSWFRWADLDLLSVENESVRLVIWPEHGADLLEFRHKPTDLDVLWKNPFCWPPRRRALDQPHGTRSEFYDVFHGGWFVSLPNGFYPTTYLGASVGCHGELQSVPWTAEVLEESAERVRIRLIGRSVRTPWMLTRELELAAGAPVVRWRERLENRSGERLPLAWLHHPGFGGPLIEGAELVTRARTLVTPPADRPDLGQLRPSYRGPWPLAPEQSGGRTRDCSRVPAANSAVEHVVHLTDFPVGWGCIWNPHRRLGFSLRWDERVFPYAWSWAAGKGGATYPLWGSCHTITLQPSTSPLRPFDQLVADNEVKWIESHGALESAMAVGFVTAADEIFSLPT